MNGTGWLQDALFRIQRAVILRDILRNAYHNNWT